MPPAPPAPPPYGKRPSGYTGRTIARCTVGEKLGRGATSHVFRAFHEGLKKDIALKILSTEAADSSEMRKRFLSEARAIAKLSHENVVKVYDNVEDQGLLCILMELVPGGTLQDRLDDVGSLEPRVAFRIAAQIARALEAAHEMKLVHRDIKPANVMLVSRLGEEMVKVVDFGLAVQADMNRVGTPMFMSPEAAQGKRIDEKSDVYALGVCLYRMLTGVLPFTGDSTKEILAAQVNMEATPPSVHKLVLGTQFDDIVKKLLVKSKGYRPSAGEAADLLEDIADDLDERAEGVQKIRRRKKRAKPKVVKKSNAMLWVGLAIAALLIVMIGYVMSTKHAATPTGGGDEAPGKQPLKEVVAPAQAAYHDVDVWIAENPANPREAARRWGLIEQRYPGTPQATLAGKNRLAAEAEANRIDNSKKPPPPPPPVDPKAKYHHFEELVKAWDFGKAADAMGELPPPDGVDSGEWTLKTNRYEYIGKHFVPNMDAGIAAHKTPIKAKELFRGAKDDEVLVFARSTGAVAKNAAGEQRTLPWSSIDIDSFFKNRVVYDRILSSASAEDNLVLAALAIEFGRSKKEIANFRELGIDQLADDDDKELKQRTLFGEK